MSPAGHMHTSACRPEPSLLVRGHRSGRGQGRWAPSLRQGGLSGHEGQKALLPTGHTVCRLDGSVMPKHWRGVKVNGIQESRAPQPGARGSRQRCPKLQSEVKVPTEHRRLREGGRLQKASWR